MRTSWRLRRMTLVSAMRAALIKPDRPRRIDRYIDFFGQTSGRRTAHAA
jgi:hypothetical protein